MSYQKFGAWSLEHRAVVFAALGVVTVLALVMLPRLRFDFQPSAMMQLNEAEREFEASFAERFDVSDNLLLIVVESETEGAITTPYGLSLMKTLTDFARTHKMALTAYSMTEVPRLPPLSRGQPDAEEGSEGDGTILSRTREFFGQTTTALSGLVPTALVPSKIATEDDVARVIEQLERSSMLDGNLISKDGRRALVIVELKDTYQDLEKLTPELQAFEASVFDLIEDPPFRAALGARAPPEFSAYLGGLPQVRSETVRLLKRDQMTFWPLVGIIFFILMIWFFRSPVQAALPLVTVGLATVWIMGLLATIGQEINILNNIIPTLILVVGICDGLHVVIRINSLRRAGASSKAAAEKAICELGFPCLLTSLTTAIGFASLLVSDAEVLRSFGWQVAVGIIMAYIAIVTAVPTLSSLLKKPPREIQVTVDGDYNGRLEHLIDRVTLFVLTYPKGVIVGALIVFAGTLALGSQVPIDARVLDTFAEGHPIHEANVEIEESFGGILPMEFQLDGGREGRFRDPDALQRVADLQAFIEKQEGVLATTSILDLLSEARLISTGEPSDWRQDAGRLTSLMSLLEAGGPEGMRRQYLTDDERYLRITARMSDQGAAQSLKTIQAIDARSESLLNPRGNKERIEMKVTGVAFLSTIGLDAFVRDLFYSLATASLVIFMVLMIVFRSWRVGLISVLPNVMPLTVALALMPVFGYTLNTSSAIVFTFGIGLAVDNTIHFLARFFEMRPRYNDLKEAIRAAFRSAGRAIVVSNLFLCAGFSALYFSDFDPTQRVAILTVVTILSALLAAIILIPALLLLLEPRGEGSRSWTSSASRLEAVAPLPPGHGDLSGG